MRITGRLQRHGVILCSFAYEADYGQYVLTSICQEKQREQAAHPEASLFLNPHLDSALGAYHSKGCWSHRRTQHKDIVPETRASKEQQGQTLYFYSRVLGCTAGQAGPHATPVRLDDFPHTHAQTYDHSAVLLLFRERVVGSFHLAME